MPHRKTSPLGWLGIALVVAIAILAVFGALGLAAHGDYYGMMGTGAWGWAAVMMAVPAVLLIAILLAAVRGMSGPWTPAAAGSVPPPSGAIEVLDARYARGEVSRDEYLRMRADLTQRPSNSGGG